MRQLLRHLEANCFEAAPRVLGVDDQGREVLTFIEGDTDSSGAPSWIWSERALVEAARLIRRYHDHSRGFQPPANPHWQVMVGAPTQGDVICHNDLAPFNAVYRQGIPVAFFDWDLAAPGTPLWDIAYAAWWKRSDGEFNACWTRARLGARQVSQVGLRCGGRRRTGMVRSGTWRTSTSIVALSASPSFDVADALAERPPLRRYALMAPACVLVRTVRT